MTDLSVMERVEREEREWATARLHESKHGNWLGPDECPICVSLVYDSPFVRLTPHARARIGPQDYLAVDARARRLNVRIGAMYSFRHHGWTCSADDGKRRISLRGSGPLAAVLAGLLDDFEALDYTPEELAQIQRQSR